MTKPLTEHVEACIIHVRALANLDLPQAVSQCEALTKDHVESVELRYLHGVLLLEFGQTEDAVQQLRRAVYLDSGLIVGHFMLASAFHRLGNLSGALRAFRNARDLARELDSSTVPLSEGESPEGLAESAQLRINAILSGQSHSEA